MGDSGFGNMDFLQACKFAEGDSRILMQKMARDRLKHFATGDKSCAAFSDEESRLCKRLGASMEAAIKAGTNKQQAWDNAWETVYELAEAVMDRVMDHGVQEFDDAPRHGT